MIARSGNHAIGTAETDRNLSRVPIGQDKCDRIKKWLTVRIWRAVTILFDQSPRKTKGKSEMMVRVQLGSGCYFEHHPDPPKTYEYRSLPCSAGDWSVCGFDSLLNGGGVLEWCFDQKDAEERIKIMQAYPQFQNLSIGSPEETKIPVYEWCSGNIRPVLWEQIDNGRSLENVRR